MTYTLHGAVGLLYAVLAGLLCILSFFRARHSRHDFADRPVTMYGPALKTVGQTGPGKRVFGRPFVTAGWIVVAVTIVVAAVVDNVLAEEKPIQRPSRA